MNTIPMAKKNHRKLICGTCGGAISSGGDELAIPDFLKKSSDLIEGTPVGAPSPLPLEGAPSIARSATTEDPQVHS